METNFPKQEFTAKEYIGSKPGKISLKSPKKGSHILYGNNLLAVILTDQGTRHEKKTYNIIWYCGWILHTVGSPLCNWDTESSPKKVQYLNDNFTKMKQISLLLCFASLQPDHVNFNQFMPVSRWPFLWMDEGILAASMTSFQVLSAHRNIYISTSL